MKRVFAWLPALCWMAVIFIMSAMPGDVSGAQSGFVTQIVMRVLALVTGGAQIDAQAAELLIRKAAHMAEYAVLFWLMLRGLRFEGVRRPMLTALLLCAGYACTDELHQSFVGGRGPSPVDVMIDTAGAAVMMAACALALYMKKQWPRAG